MHRGLQNRSGDDDVMPSTAASHPWWPLSFSISFTGSCSTPPLPGPHHHMIMHLARGCMNWSGCWCQQIGEHDLKHHEDDGDDVASASGNDDDQRDPDDDQADATSARAPATWAPGHVRAPDRQVQTPGSWGRCGAWKFPPCPEPRLTDSVVADMSQRLGHSYLSIIKYLSVYLLIYPYTYQSTTILK